MVVLVVDSESPIAGVGKVGGPVGPGGEMVAVVGVVFVELAFVVAATAVDGAGLSVRLLASEEQLARVSAATRAITDRSRVLLSVSEIRTTSTVWRLTGVGAALSAG